MIDLHAHILPGLDDGPVDLEHAMELARAAAAAGTRAVAATSHVDRGFALTPARLAEARAGLTARLADEGVPLRVLQGGEIAANRALDLSDEDLRGLTLGGSAWLLLECPFVPVTGMGPIVEDLQARGFAVLLAHPERSPAFQRRPEALGELVDGGALAQVTAGSFAGDFGERPRRVAEAMLEAGLVHVLASDAHDTGARPPDLTRMIEPLEQRFTGAREQVAWMAGALPEALLAGTEAPERPPLPRRR